MIQTFSSSFRTAPTAALILPAAVPSANVGDYFNVVTPPQSGWSTGASLVDSANLVPQAAQRWQITQVTVSALLTFFAGVPAFGKAGKILAGVSIGSEQTSGPLQGQAFIQGAQLPTDLSGVGTLWDPASDPMPPNSQVLTHDPPGPQLPISLTLSPTQPINLSQAETLGVGIWMAPGLYGSSGLGSIGLTVSTAEYSLSYDDGQPARPGIY